MDPLFNCDETHRNIPINEKFKVQIAEKIYDEDRPSRLKAKERRLERENAWMLHLQTVFLLGLNTQIKGLGIVNQPGRHKLYNLYSLSASFDKNLKVPKRKRRRRTYNRIRAEDGSKVHLR